MTSAMRIKIPLSIGLPLLVICWFAASSYQNNSPPAVTITAPLNNSKFQWNSVVAYAIHVSDPEDGNSEYNEIPSREVLLMVAYLPDSKRVKPFLAERSKTNQEALFWMVTSTCFTCHSAKDKLIGPSLEQIAKRYPDNSVSVESLTKKIIAGSTGTWGDLKMPPHPDLNIDQVRKIVQWILKNSSDRDQSFYVGMEGAFRTKEKPTGESGKGVYILTASYTDHGIKGASVGPSDGKQGQHTIVLKNY